MGKAQVLIVDDEAKLEAMRYSVFAEVSFGKEAIGAANWLHSDLVLMDVELSGEMDGIDAAEEIRRRLNIPVVYLTSHADEETVARQEDGAVWVHTQAILRRRAASSREDGRLKARDGNCRENH